MAVKEATCPPGKCATTKPSRESARFSGAVRAAGESSERSRSPNVVCTRMGPSERTFRVGFQLWIAKFR